MIYNQHFDSWVCWEKEYESEDRNIHMKIDVIKLFKALITCFQPTHEQVFKMIAVHGTLQPSSQTTPGGEGGESRGKSH